MAPGLPAIRADRDSLLQALDNIIDNAIKYSPGARTLTIRVFADADQGEKHQELKPAQELPPTHMFNSIE